MTTLALAILRAAFEAGLRDDKCVFVQPKDGLNLLAVVEAAKALRPYVIPITLNGVSSKHEIAAFDAALAKLGELK